MLQWIDFIGTGVFAISGALTAYEKKLDIFGISSVAFITALGGGTLRDLLIGNTPVSWMSTPIYLVIIAVGIIIAMVFKTKLSRLRRTFFFFDTVGIAVFTILGLQKALNIDLGSAIAIMMGMVSAVFGGVIRDIVCNEIPLIFRKEIYAMACLVGGGFYILLVQIQLPDDITIVAAILLIFLIRALSVRYHWQLPGVK